MNRDALIIATGATAKWLGLPTEESFRGGGVSACATCDGFFFRGKEVVVVGGGNTAVEEALYLTHHAIEGDAGPSPRHLPRREDPAGPAVQESQGHRAVGSRGAGDHRRDASPRRWSPASRSRTSRRARSSRSTDGVFIAIGHSPNTELFKGKLAMDSEGYLDHAARIRRRPTSTASTPRATCRTRSSARP